MTGNTPAFPEDIRSRIKRSQALFVDFELRAILAGVEYDHPADLFKDGLPEIINGKPDIGPEDFSIPDEYPPEGI